jgi:hypothetical protein
MPDEQSRRQKHLKQLQSLGLSEEKATEVIDSETPFYNDFIIIDKLVSLSEGQEKLSKRSDWQIGLTVLIFIIALLALAVALHWL